MAHKTLRGLAFGTPQYVVAHGTMRRQQGKSLSASLLGTDQELNPRKAFAKAQQLLEQPKAKRSPFNRWGQTALEEWLGIPPPWQDPWPGAIKVPHTCYQFY